MTRTMESQSKRYLLPTLAAGLAVLVLGAGDAQGALLASESFDYGATGEIVGKGSAADPGWDGAWAGVTARSELVAPTNAMYVSGTDYFVNGGTYAAQVTDDGNPAVISRALDTISDSEVWVSFLIRFDAGTAGDKDQVSIHFKDYNKVAAGLKVTTSGSSNDFFVSATGTHAAVGPDVTAGNASSNTHMVVVRLYDKTTYSPNYGAMQIWMNPTSSVQGAAAATSTGNTAISSLTLFSVFSSNIDAGDQILLDEIKIGTSWGDVVPQQAKIKLDTVTDDTIITGGTSTGLGVTVTNDRGAGYNNLNYSVTAAQTGGSVTPGAASPASGSLAAGSSQGVTLPNATSTNVGNSNKVTFTVSDPNAYNSPQTAEATLTVLAHSNAKFTDQGGSGTKTFSNFDDDLEIDFGSLAQGSGNIDSFFDIFAQIVTASFTAGLDLDLVSSSGDTGVLGVVGRLGFSNNPAGYGEPYTARFDTSATVASYAATYIFKLSDQDLNGATAPQSEHLTLTLKGTVTPEPATLALMGLGGLALMTARRRR